MSGIKVPLLKIYRASACYITEYNVFLFSFFPLLREVLQYNLAGAPIYKISK